MLTELDKPLDELAALAPAALAGLSQELEAAKAVLKRRDDALRATLERIYGDRITTAYSQAQKDGGVIRVPASNTLNLKVDRDKTVEWDQDGLKAALNAMSADDAKFYCKAKLEVEAKKFEAAPPAIKGELAKLRTVKIGRSRFSFEPVEGLS